MRILLCFVVGAIADAQTTDPDHIFVKPYVGRASAAPNSNVPMGILPVQYRAAYGFNRTPNQGQGQTIALVVAYDDPNVADDLAFYANYFHLTPCNFQKVKVGNPFEGGDWDLTASYDVEQACAIAPGANVLLVEATTDSLADLFNAIAVASSSPYNASVIVMSWGTPEFQGEQSFDSYLCNIVNGNGQPVTFVAATNWVVYPAASPCVVAAGQTVLTLSTVLPPAYPLQLDYGSESAWSRGGISAYESRPSWQNPACSGFSAVNRCLPDIAADAENLPVYDTYDQGGWREVDAPGLSAPAWGAFFTLVNSGRASQGKNTLNQAAADMYAIYYSSDYLTDFHDILTGDLAGPGYDLATGIGTYQADKLFSALVAAAD